MSTYIATTRDGRYGLTGPDDHGYHRLFRIVTTPKPEEWGDGFPEWGDYEVGYVSDPENIEEAALAAEEEMAHLIAQARDEFGLGDVR